jgi:hypothetical protein
MTLFIINALMYFIFVRRNGIIMKKDIVRILSMTIVLIFVCGSFSSTFSAPKDTQNPLNVSNDYRFDSTSGI